MKLRIAHMTHPNRPGGIYVIQKREIGISLSGFWMWSDMYYNIKTKQLEEDIVLGQMVVKAQFENWHEANRVAQAYLTSEQPRIIHTWEVNE